MTKTFTKTEVKTIQNIVTYCRLDNLGGDPEFFIVDNFGDLVSSDLVLPKKTDGSKIDAYTDGVQGEISLQESTCRDSIHSHIRSSLNILHNNLSKHNNERETYLNLHVKLLPLVKLSELEMKHLTKVATTFGCKPDFNGYNNGKANNSNLNGSKHPWRYGGGHIHIELPNNNIGRSSTYDMDDSSHPNPRSKAHGESSIRLVKLLDIFVGVPSVLLTRDNAKQEALRRSCYGRAGDYRQTAYGIEYRTLSNFWLISPQAMSLVFALTRIGTNIYMKGSDKLLAKIFEVFPADKIQKIIDTSDVKEAEKVFEMLKPLIMKYEKTYNHWSNPFVERFKREWEGVFKYGVFKFWEDLNIFGNWGLHIFTDSYTKRPMAINKNRYGRGFLEGINFIKNRLDFLESVSTLETLKEPVKANLIKQRIAEIKRGC